ncbi:MAG: hypothetical protein U0746_10190 [Gemmataceae bacterium]
MPRALAYALLTVLGPLQLGVAVTTVHPALDCPECWWVAAIAAACAFEAARRNLKRRPEAPPWTWLRLWVTRLWLTPLLLLLAAHLLVTAFFLRPEFGQAISAMKPEPAPAALLLDVPPPRTVPRDPVPALRAIAQLVTALATAAGVFIVRIVFAAPPWLLTVAVGVGCLFWRTR